MSTYLGPGKLLQMHSIIGKLCRDPDDAVRTASSAI